VNTTLNLIASRHYVGEPRDRASRRRADDDELVRSAGSSVELRSARPDEEGVVRRLAALDDAPALEGPAMLAVIDGEAVAALSFGDLRVVANPFVRTQHAVDLLRLRVDHLSGGSERGRRRPRRLARPRFAF
jgi:hypothetical protein